MKRLFECMRIVIICLAVIFLNGCGSKDPGSLPASSTIKFGDILLIVSGSALDDNFPAGCTGQPPTCSPAKSGYRFFTVEFTPVNLPAGQTLPYKSIPAVVSIKDNSGTMNPKSLYIYDNNTRVLKLGFEVPVSAKTFTLMWPGNADLLLNLH
jgi:hypothetical protein